MGLTNRLVENGGLDGRDELTSRVLSLEGRVLRNLGNGVEPKVYIPRDSR